MSIVEATNAGPGNLEVIVNQGKVPSTPKSLGPSLYAITFVPSEPEIHGNALVVYICYQNYLIIII